MSVTVLTAKLTGGQSVNYNLNWAPFTKFDPLQYFNQTFLVQTFGYQMICCIDSFIKDGRQSVG